MLISNHNVKSKFRKKLSILILNRKSKNEKSGPKSVLISFLIRKYRGKQGIEMRHFNSYWYISFLNGIEQLTETGPGDKIDTDI